MTHAPMSPRLRLGVNIDHVATIRNARGGDHRAIENARCLGSDVLDPKPVGSAVQRENIRSENSVVRVHQIEVVFAQSALRRDRKSPWPDTAWPTPLAQPVKMNRTPGHFAPLVGENMEFMWCRPGQSLG
jgi:hypothetical protein